MTSTTDQVGALQVPEEVKMTALLVRKFVNDELIPIEDRVDKADGLTQEEYEHLVARVKELGLWNLGGSPEWGGGGFGTFPMSVVMEEKGKTSIYLSQFAGIFGGNEPPPGATDYQNDNFFIPAMQGEMRGCMALTEPGGGSDTRAIKTRAVRDGDNFVINGSKTFITNAIHADYVLVTCVTDPEKGRNGFSRIIVPAGTPGMTMTPQEMLGMRGGKQAAIYFDNCTVPASHVVDDGGQGYTKTLRGLQAGRVMIAASSVGTAVRCLNMSTEYARQRTAYGGPIINHQGVSFKLADMAIGIAAARGVTRQAAWKADTGEDYQAEAGIAKVFASEMVGRVVDEAIQIHGGSGYSLDLPFERMWRDVRLWRIGEGTSEIQRWIIARALQNHFYNAEDAF